MTRRFSRQIHAGNVAIGGNAPVSVQSMTSTKTADVKATVAQIHALTQAGCEIVRVAVPDMEAAQAIAEIKKGIRIPLVADIHFDYRLALESVKAGADKIRINPGNIGGQDRVRAVADACKAKGLPIRIGVNSGSVARNILEKYGGPTPEALCESALSHIALLEQEHFYDICVSIKSSDVITTVDAYRRLAEKVEYPLHLGVTMTGTTHMGQLKSAAGIGGLLALGIGDTLRVSLTADPVEEVYTGLDILEALDLRRRGISVVSCPTCGRCRIDLQRLVNEAEEALKNCKKPLRVAIMGCAVNGPGEAREADIGIAAGMGDGLLFKNGEILRKVPEEQLLSELLKEIEAM